MNLRVADKISSPIRMEALPYHTNIIISCDKGQNIAIQRLLDGVNNLTYPQEITVEIKRKRASRSKQANSYMWVLCDEIAKVINSTKEEVYRNAIRAVGVYNDVAVQRGGPSASLIGSWTNRGIGFFVETFESNLRDKYGGKMLRVRLYEGSHMYSKEEMSRLIDYVVEDAKALGIETETPEEIARMKASWGEI